MKKRVFALLIAGAVGSASAPRVDVGGGIVASNQNYTFAMTGPAITGEGDGANAFSLNAKYAF